MVLTADGGLRVTIFHAVGGAWPAVWLVVVTNNFMLLIWR